MSIDGLFSVKAGRRERMLKRQFQNPLFEPACGVMNIEPFDIQDARKQDAQEVEEFIEHFRELVQKVAELEPNADAYVILKLKELLDKTYEASSGLAGDQDEIREMIKRLLAMMMQSMWKAVGNDTQGISKLEMEEEARQAHFTLLEHPFIADLLAPDSPVDEKMMVPCLLSESSDTVALAVQLFDPEQQQSIYQQAAQLIETMDESHPRVQEDKCRLQEIAAVMTPVNQQPS